MRDEHESTDRKARLPPSAAGAHFNTAGHYFGGRRWHARDYYAIFGEAFLPPGQRADIDTPTPLPRSFHA